MSFNIRQTAFAVGRVKQADLVTSNIDADLIAFTKRNQDIGEVPYTVADDAQDIGKSDEFAVNTYLISKEARFRLEADLTTELLAFALAYGMGSSVDSAPAAGAYRHTATPQSAGIDLLPFTVVERLPSSGTAALDRAMIGCVVDGFTISFNNGPSRENSTLALDIVGTGKTVSPSTLTIPAVGTLHRLNAGSFGVTILTTNYVTGGRIVSMEMSWRNNVRLDQGFFIGSGADEGFQIRGRMEHGDREARISVVARLETDSSELTKLAAQTEGTVIVTGQGSLITGSTYHDMSVTWQRCRIGSAIISNDAGIATVQFDIVPMKHSSNGLVTAYATNEIALFGAET